MSFQRVYSKHDLWEGEMGVLRVGGTKVLLLYLEGGEVRAIPPGCPHQAHPLVDRRLEGNVLTCAAHEWEFDVETGAEINPDDAEAELFPVRTDGDEIYVDLDGN